MRYSVRKNTGKREEGKTKTLTFCICKYWGHSDVHDLLVHAGHVIAVVVVLVVLVVLVVQMLLRGSRHRQT